MGVIYKATNMLNKKSYIGQTRRSLEIRKKEHELDSNLNKSNSAFHFALKKYGFDNFSWEILEECDDDQLNAKEIFWIDYYDTYISGYNMTVGGQTGLNAWQEKHFEEWQDNLSKGRGLLKEKNPKKFEEIRQLGTKASKVPVRCIELNLIFDSISSAARWSQTDDNPNRKAIKPQSITRVCRGSRKTTGGYHWEYI